MTTTTVWARRHPQLAAALWFGMLGMIPLLIYIASQTPRFLNIIACALVPAIIWGISAGVAGRKLFEAPSTRRAITTGLLITARALLIYIILVTIALDKRHVDDIFPDFIDRFLLIVGGIVVFFGVPSLIYGGLLAWVLFAAGRGRRLPSS